MYGVDPGQPTFLDSTMGHLIYYAWSDQTVLGWITYCQRLHQQQMTEMNDEEDKGEIPKQKSVVLS